MKKIIETLAILFLASLILLPTKIGLADISPVEDVNLLTLIDKSTFLDPDYLSADIIIKAPAESFNVFDLKLSFDPSMLSVNTSTYNASSCEIVIQDSFDNKNGFLELICGNPQANTSEISTIASIKFNKLSVGWTKLTISDSQILGNSGYGKNILNQAFNNNIYLIK